MRLFPQQREAALALFGRFGDDRRLRSFVLRSSLNLVVPFGETPTTAGEAFQFSSSAKSAHRNLRRRRRSGERFDALPRVRSERRIVILISDGLDNASRLKPVGNSGRTEEPCFFLRNSLAAVRAARWTLAVRPPAKGFRDLAEKTGGKYFLVGDASVRAVAAANRTGNDLTPIFQAIEDDLRSQYLLGFYAGEALAMVAIIASRSACQPASNIRSVVMVISQTHEFFVNVHVGTRR